jgi:hypothetical protein
MTSVDNGALTGIRIIDFGQRRAPALPMVHSTSFLSIEGLIVNRNFRHLDGGK